MNKNIVNAKKMIHVGYVVESRDQTADILMNVFGLNHCIKQHNDKPYVSKINGLENSSVKVGFLRATQEDIPLEILEYEHPRAGHMQHSIEFPGTAHIGFETDDLDLLEKKLLNYGIEHLSKPSYIKSGPWINRKGAFISMPDGLIIEILESEEKSDSIGAFTKLHHVGYSVSDIDYISVVLRDVFGLKPIDNTDGDNEYYKKGCLLNKDFQKAALFALQDNSFYIELLEYDTSGDEKYEVDINMIGNVHLCFEVENLNAVHAALTNEKLNFVGPPALVTSGVNKGAKAIYLKDPYELRCELFQAKGSIR